MRLFIIIIAEGIHNYYYIRVESIVLIKTINSYYKNMFQMGNLRKRAAQLTDFSPEWFLVCELH